jgi:hypothetical protein
MRRNLHELQPWTSFCLNTYIALLAGYLLYWGSVHYTGFTFQHNIQHRELLRSSSSTISSPFRKNYITPLPFKLYIYDMPPSFNSQIRRENRRCSSSMFASEVALHTWLLNNKDVRTLDPNEADLFYVPAYTTCRSTAFAGNGPDPWAGKELMAKAISWVQTNYPNQWKKNNGRDHIFTAVHDYGPCFDFLRKRAHQIGPLKELSNSILLMSLGDKKSKCFNIKKDIPIPTFIPSYPFKGSHKNDDDDLLQANWNIYVGNHGPSDVESNSKDNKDPLQSLPIESRSVPGNRKIFVFFWGQLKWTDANGNIDHTYSHGIRQNLEKQFVNDKLFVIHHVSREGTGGLDFIKYSQMLDSSVFCLSPAGFAPWTKRLYEAIIHGCIPIIIGDVLIPPYENQLNWSTFSIRVSETELSNGQLKYILNSLSTNDIHKMQINLNRIKESMIYRLPDSKPIDVYWNRFVDNDNNAFDYILRELSTKLNTWVQQKPTRKE